MTGSKAQGEELAAEWSAFLCRYYKTTGALDRALVADHGLAVSDFEVLQQLFVAKIGSAEGRVRFHDLGAQTHLTQSALSRLVSRLVKAGLVARSTAEDDRRSMWVQITPAGEQRFLEARPTHRAILAELAEGAADDSAE